MRLALASALVVCSLAAACSPKGAGAARQPPKVVDIRAEGCDDECRFVTLSILVENNGSDPICVPSVYGGGAANGALAFTYKADGKFIGTSEPYDPNVFWSRNYKSDMVSLSDGPQYVVPGHKSRLIRAVMERKFSLRNAPAKGSIRIATFSCGSIGSGDGGINIYTIEKDVSFE